MVAKSLTHIECVDYDETLSRVVRFSLIRLKLSLVAYMNLELFQMDVETVFLLGDLNEKIYMQ